MKESVNWSLIFLQGIKLEHDISLKDESLYLKERKITGLEGEVAQNTRAREDFV